jgi:hypothetical protein
VGEDLSPLVLVVYGLLYPPQMTDEGSGAFGEMRIGRGNQSIHSKPVTVPFLSSKNLWTDMGFNLGCHNASY